MASTNLGETQATLVLTVPGIVIVITPNQVHRHLDVLLSAGILPIITVGEPGAHGAGMTGMQGAGVSTPAAAAVFLITSGFVARCTYQTAGYSSSARSP